MSYTLLGGMGMFFFGMKILSESLQALSGDMVRRAIRAVTDNRVLAVLAGVFLTALLQSSTLCTVMVVGLVNAQLMALSQAIGVIFGANIGTTVTGWLIALQLGKYGLAFIGVGVLPLLLGRSATWKQVGYLLVALGLIFIGVQHMTSAFVPLKDAGGFNSVMAYFTADSFLSLMACIAIGALLTMLIHSSSGMVALTIALATTGAITYQSAVAISLGAEIGTTITAVMAGLGANTNAKRAGLAHAIFNIVSVMLMVPIFYWYIGMVDGFVAGDPAFVNEAGVHPYAGLHIAGAQTVFNIVGTLLFLPFLKTLEKFVVWLTPEPPVKEIPHLKYLKSSIDMEAPALALATAEQELSNMADITGRAVDATVQYIVGAKEDKALLEKVLHYEEVTDAIQVELTVFLCRAQQGRLTEEQSRLAYALIRASDELESVADYCGSVVRSLSRLHQGPEGFTAPAQEDLLNYARAVAKNYHNLASGLGQSGALDPRRFDEERKALGHEGDRLREQHRRRIESGSCSAIAGMVFTDAMVGLRKLKGHTYEVVRALSTQS